jgi:hypothetical protein
LGEGGHSTKRLKENSARRLKNLCVLNKVKIVKVFIIVTFTFCVLLLCSEKGSSQTQTSPNPEFPITGAEVWDISGTNYNIEGTSLLVMGNGQTLFVIKALCDFQPDASHKPIARSLAKYAVGHGYHKKVSASWGNDGKPQPFSDAVGVALIHKSGIGPLAVSSGYKYHFTVVELQDKQPDGESSTSTNRPPATDSK